MEQRTAQPISIILPTLNERENIVRLLERIRALSLAGEVIVVDDASTDGTAEAAEAFQSHLRVRVIRRPGKLGLASAVIDGLSAAQHKLLMVMDADLSHDPSILPAMRDALDGGAGVVIGSRYIHGGGVVGWPIRRQMMSLFATWVAKILLHVNEKDPMSGYFGLRREVFERVKPQLRPRGYKILLEVLVRARPVRTKEIGFVFQDREYGKSKISGKIAAEYGRMVLELLFRKQ